MNMGGYTAEIHVCDGTHGIGVVVGATLLRAQKEARYLVAQLRLRVQHGRIVGIVRHDISDCV